MTATSQMTVRVWVTDVWDNFVLAATPAMSVRDVKKHALEKALSSAVDADAYQVKFRGALVENEEQTMADLNVPDGAPLIVLPARRQPVV